MEDMVETVIDNVLKQREIDRLTLERFKEQSALNQYDVRLYRPGPLDKVRNFFDDLAKRPIIYDDGDRTSPL